MPLTISRRSIVGTVASSDTSGMKGSKISHSASVRSEGYAFRSLISSYSFLCFLHSSSPFLYRLGDLVLTLSEEAGLSPGVLWEINEKRMTVELPTTFGPQQFSGKPDLIECLIDNDEAIWVKLTDWKSKRDIGHDFL